MTESAQSDERGSDEASDWNDMQSSYDKWDPPSVKDYAIGHTQSGMIFETCDRSVYLCAYVQLTTVNIFGIS